MSGVRYVVMQHIQYQKGRRKRLAVISHSCHPFVDAFVLLSLFHDYSTDYVIIVVVVVVVVLAAIVYVGHVA